MIINYVTTILIILRAPSIILFTLWITSSTVSRLFLIVRLASINNMVLCTGMYGCLAIKTTCLCNVFLPKIIKVCISPHKYDSLDWKKILQMVFKICVCNYRSRSQYFNQIFDRSTRYFDWNTGFIIENTEFIKNLW